MEVPDSCQVFEYNHREPGQITGYGDFIKNIALDESILFPIETADLYIVNDAYRPTPTARILSWLDTVDKLNPNSKFIIATGSHQAPTEDQLKWIFGEYYEHYKSNIHIHDANDAGSMTEIGVDSLGGAVYVNKAYLKAERIVVIGSVEPHYFAGFTGGRKSIFPGICDLATIARNHNKAVSLDAMPMKLHDNPVEEHLQELVGILPEKEIICIQTIQDSKKIGEAIFVGNLDSAFQKGVGLSREIYGNDCTADHDLILAEVLPPLDANLYQLQKSLENCRGALKKGGTVLLFSPCDEGIGSSSFYSLAEKWDPQDEIIPEGPDVFGIHKLSRVYEMNKLYDIYLYSNLGKGVPEKVYFQSTDDPQKIIDNVVVRNSSAKVGLVHDAGHTVLANTKVH